MKYRSIERIVSLPDPCIVAEGENFTQCYRVDNLGGNGHLVDRIKIEHVYQIEENGAWRDMTPEELAAGFKAAEEAEKEDRKVLEEQQ